jgi:hypothetical protein
MTKPIATATSSSESPRRSTLLLGCGPHGLPLDGARCLKTLRLVQAQQALAHHEEVGQCAGDDEAMPVLRQAAVAHLSEAEHPLEHANRVFDPGPDPRQAIVRDGLYVICCVARYLTPVHYPAERPPELRASLRITLKIETDRSGFADHLVA